MEVFIVVCAVILMVAGLVGCFLPFLPGPPLSYVALWLLQLRNEPPFSTQFLLIMGGITVVITVLDYFIPIWGTKKFGGTDYGVWGCTIGLIIGFAFGPIGIIVGPFLGAFAGEMIASKDSTRAWRSALGSFIGFVAGTLLKLVVCGVMLWYLVAAFV